MAATTAGKAAKGARKRVAKKTATESVAAKKSVPRTASSKRGDAKHVAATSASPRDVSAKKTGAKQIAATSAGPRKTAAKKTAAERVVATVANRRKTIEKKTPGTKVTGTPVLLSGGNPQIAKGYGDAPVQAYIAAMPGWKSAVGRRLDALIVRSVPGVSKAVKWNSPLYGIDGDGWFLGIHVFTHYIKVAFFRGASLRPVPPGTSTQKDVRYLDIREDDALDEAQFAGWVKQASRLPGERM